MKELGSRLSKLPEAMQLIDGVCSFHHTMLPLCISLEENVGSRLDVAGQRAQAQRKPVLQAVKGMQATPREPFSISRETSTGRCGFLVGMCRGSRLSGHFFKEVLSRRICW